MFIVTSVSFSLTNSVDQFTAAGYITFPPRIDRCLHQIHRPVNNCGSQEGSDERELVLCTEISKSLRFLPVLFNHFFGLIYSFGEQDRPGTTLGAFEVVLTGPDTIRLIKAWKAFLESLITGVRQKTVGLGDGCRS